MRKIILPFIALFLVSCGVKQTQNLLSNGNYDAAIEKATESLSTNKDAKGKQEYVYLLQEAFEKAVERDQNNIKLLQKENNAANYEKIYDLYVQLANRQDKIRALLPLKLLDKNRNATFVLEDYSDAIVTSKTNLSNYLYANSLKLLQSNNKLDARQAYDDFMYLDKLNPNFKDVRKKIDEAQLKGTDFVLIYTKNETNIAIPKTLENDLLNFGTSGLNDKWTVYHNNKQKKLDYDFGILVNFRNIAISPEQIKEKEFSKEKQIKDGVKNLLDNNGNIVKDSLGNPIKVDNFKTIKIDIYEFRQFKSCQVTAKVDYLDYRTKQLQASFPLTTEFVFENIYANYNGDRNACEEDYLSNFNNKALPFPTNEQMIFDSGEDLKAKLKSIISKNRLRNF